MDLFVAIQHIYLFQNILYSYLSQLFVSALTIRDRGESIEFNDKSDLFAFIVSCMHGNWNVNRFVENGFISILSRNRDWVSI